MSQVAQQAVNLKRTIEELKKMHGSVSILTCINSDRCRAIKS